MKWILIVLAILVLLRLLLPYIILRFLNFKLTRQKNLRGTVGTVTIKLMRRHISLKNIRIYKKEEVDPFLIVGMVEVSFKWAALLKKKFVGSIAVIQAEVELDKEQWASADTGADDQSLQPSHLRAMLQRMIPFCADLVFHECTVRYKDLHASPPVDVALEHIEVVVKDFSNFPQRASYPATIRATSKTFEGTLNLHVRLYPLEEFLNLDLNFELVDGNMVLLNDFFRQYAHVDIGEGSFDIYSEVNVKNGVFKGYVKPILKNLKIVTIEDSGDRFFQKLWEGLVGFVVRLLRNKKTGDLATEIPVQGFLANPKIDVLSAIAGVFQNAFINAIRPSWHKPIVRRLLLNHKS